MIGFVLFLCTRTAAQTTETTATAPTTMATASTTPLSIESLLGCWQIEEAKFYASDKLDVVFALAELFITKQNTQFVGAFSFVSMLCVCACDYTFERTLLFRLWLCWNFNCLVLRARAGTVWHEFGESNFSATPTFGELEFEIAGGCLLNCTTKTTVRRVSGFVRVCVCGLAQRTAHAFFRVTVLIAKDDKSVALERHGQGRVRAQSGGAADVDSSTALSKVSAKESELSS